MIDTHAHLYDTRYQSDLDSLIKRSQKANVEAIYMPNLALETIAPMLKVAHTYPNYCYPMLGLHPCEIDANYRQQLHKMAQWLDKHPFVAIGEIGIDLYHTKATKVYQIEAFKIQLQWAIDHQVPVVLHCRDSIDEVIDILSQIIYDQQLFLKGIFHCFTGTLSQAKKAIELGFYLGIGGISTYKKNNPMQDFLPYIDLKHMVLETDSPYLAPVPHRGKRNEPAYLTHISAEIAKIKNVPIAHVNYLSTANARLLFSKTTQKK
ncbi:MAG: TatD family hydrolase [Bacteroidota bacterium]